MKLFTEKQFKINKNLCASCNDNELIIFFMSLCWQFYDLELYQNDCTIKAIENRNPRLKAKAPIEK